MVVFLLSLLLICAVAFGVVAAFALPHLRAGSPVLTDRGERLAGRMARRLRPVTSALRPVVAPVVRPVVRLVRRAARPVLRAARPRLAPMTRAIARAVEEGAAPSVVLRPAQHAGRRSDRPADRPADPDGAEPAQPGRAPAAASGGVEILRTVSSLRTPAPRAEVVPPLARR